MRVTNRAANLLLSIYELKLQTTGDFRNVDLKIQEASRLLLRLTLGYQLMDCGLCSMKLTL
jgi:hypothetical protein